MTIFKKTNAQVERILREEQERSERIQEEARKAAAEAERIAREAAR